MAKLNWTRTTMRTIEWKRVDHAAGWCLARYEGRTAATGRRQAKACGMRTRNANAVWASRGWFLVVL